MFETPITIVGNIVTKPDRKRVGDQELIKFRVASNSRRRTADGNWEPGNSLFVTVNCWGRLVTGVGAALGKGDPVVVVGYVYTSEYDDKDGNRRSSVEVRATSVGPDLARCVARIESRRQSSVTSDDAAESAVADTDDPTDDPEDPAIDGKALPLSAVRIAAPVALSARATWPRLRWSASITKDSRKATPRQWPNSSIRCGRSARRTATR
jgi:single-strand DNA-binding protein